MDHRSYRRVVLPLTWYKIPQMSEGGILVQYGEIDTGSCHCEVELGQS